MPDTRYRRDSVTGLGFALIGVWACFVYLVGPLSTAARSSLGLSDAESGFIATAFAAGLIGSSVIGPWAVRRWGRRRALASMLAAMAAASVVLAAVDGYGVLLMCVFLVGLAGAVMVNTATAVLSDHHLRHRAQAITEGNAAGAWLGLVSPAVLAVSLSWAAGWQGAVWLFSVLPVLVLPLVLAVLPPDRPMPSRVHADRPRTPLPRSFAVSMVCVAAAVGAEFSVNFWAAPLIVERTGTGLATATAALTAAVFGIAVGRTFSARLPGRFPLSTLIAAAFAVLSLGMAALLLAPGYPSAVAALFVVGLGLSVLFPFSQSLALTLASDQADRAVAVVALVIGLAMGSAPFVLGLLAGVVGLRSAFLLAFVMVAAGIVAAVAVGRMADAEPHPRSRRG